MNWDRLEKILGFPVPPDFRGWVEASPHPTAVLARLERWLNAVSSPPIYFEGLASHPEGARRLITVLAMSSHLSDVLVQNPELSEVVIEDDLAVRVATEEAIVAEGKRLLATTTSYSHQLDRLRFLKQKHSLRLASHESTGLLSPEATWIGLSELARGIVRLAAEAAWRQYCDTRKASGEVPVLVVAMGKLGGMELNYSSDIDLMFILRDEADEATERHAIRYCEMLRAALADRMGRGALYRVDLRLRPFGSQGPVVSRWRAVESYYAKYSEPWEQMALIRSDLIGAEPEQNARWEQLRNTVAFKEVRGEWVVDHLIAMKEKAEALGGEDDLKRGPGGIRDIEFLTQINQLLIGTVREKSTLPALSALGKAGALPPDLVAELRADYSFLRRLEHLCQIEGDRQVYRLPEGEEEVAAISRCLGFVTPTELHETLASLRTRVREAYQEWIPGQAKRQLLKIAPHPGLKEWIEGLPGVEAYSQSLIENRDSLTRLTHLIESAPVVAQEVKASGGIDGLISGEVLEATDWTSRWQKLARKGVGFWAGAWRRDRASCWARGVLGFDPESRDFSDLHDGLLSGLVGDQPLTVIALGSWGAREMSPLSDADGILFVNPGADGQASEATVLRLMAELREAKGKGAPVSLDLRLRPEGQSGRLSVTLDQFERYAQSSMEDWERFALGRARLVSGDPSLFAAVQSTWMRTPLDDHGLANLLAMKKRIENERVSPLVRARHLKLGNGGLDDLVWLVQLWLMRHPFAAEGVSSGTLERIRALTTAGLVNALEAEQLAASFRLLTQLRLRIASLGYEHDLLPENPDKLLALAKGVGLRTANELLGQYRDTTQAVRTLFEEGTERMRA